MKAYRLLQRLSAGFFGVLLLVGISSQFLHSRHELFPFYSWFLFSLVPQPDATVYDLLIHEAPAGRVFDPPISYRQAGEGIVRSPHSVDFYRTVQELGRAASARDAEACDWLRTGVERRLRISGPVRYEIVKQTYEDAVARWAARDSAPRHQEGVAEFVAGVPTTFPAADTTAAPAPSPAADSTVAPAPSPAADTTPAPALSPAKE